MNAHPAFQIVWKTKRLMRVHVSSFSTFFKKKFFNNCNLESWISRNARKCWPCVFVDILFIPNIFFLSLFAIIVHFEKMWKIGMPPFVPVFPSFFSNRNNERNLIFRLRFSNIELFAKGLRTYERIFIEGKILARVRKGTFFFTKKKKIHRIKNYRELLV